MNFLIFFSSLKNLPVNKIEKFCSLLQPKKYPTYPNTHFTDFYQ